MMTGDELTSHLNVWHESALAKGEAGLPHGMSPAVASAYEAYHRGLHHGPADHRHVNGEVHKTWPTYLACGHMTFVNGKPEPGGYITCLECQGQQKIVKVDDQA
jgi:hypothetical protein